MSTPTDSPEHPSSPPAPRARGGTLRPTLYRMHSWAGVLVAPFLVVAALTGLLYALSPSLEQIVYRDALTTSATGEHIPVSRAIAAAREVHPNLDLAGVQVDERADATVRVLFADPSLPNSAYKQAVFVDPVTAEVVGDMPQYASFGSLPLRTLIDQGHSNLWLGSPGASTRRWPPPGSGRWP